MDDLQPSQVEWLSLIRYQLTLARTQLSQPEPLNVLAISTVHDAVEAMLSLAAEYLSADVRAKSDFIKVFDAVNDALLPDRKISGHRSAMLSLNNARVDFKHYGNRLDGSTLERHIANGAAFVSDLADHGLGVEFDRISILNLVHNDTVRKSLELAQRNQSLERRKEAIQNLWIAFDDLIEDFESRKSWYPGRSIFSTRPNSVPSSRELHDQGTIAERGFEWLENLDSWVRVLSMGVDARQYAYFNAHTPSGVRLLGGSIQFAWTPNPDLSDEAFERCQQFVVETALSLSTGDFSFDAWSARQALNASERYDVKYTMYDSRSGSH